MSPTADSRCPLSFNCDGVVLPMMPVYISYFRCEVQDIRLAFASFVSWRSGFSDINASFIWAVRL